MKKCHLIILLLLPAFSFAQSNYKTGYVINLKGDTIHGFINFREWGTTPQNIEFKSALSDKSKQLGVNDINYFEISGYVRYRLYTVSISTNPVDINSPAAANDTLSTTGAVFLEILQQGKYLTLYTYKDALKQRFYIKDNGAAIPAELRYGIYQDLNAESSIVDKTTYRAQLLQMAERYNASSVKLISNVQQANYTDYAMIAIAAQINGNKGKGGEAVPSGNPSLRFYAGAAFTSNSLKFSNGAPFYQGPHYTASSPRLTIGMDLFANPDVGHLLFRLEVGYTALSYNIEELENSTDNAANPINGSEIFKMNEIFLNPQIIYNVYNAANLKVFLDAGYSFNLLSYPSTTFRDTQENQVIEQVTVKGLPFSKDNSSGFMVKGGVVVSKRVEIFAAYFLSAQITVSPDYNTSFSSFQAGANYFIGKVAK